LLDAMLEMPMAEVLERVPLDLETKAVLLGQASLLRPVYQLMLAHESGEWEAVGQLCQNLKLQSEDVAGLYWQAQQWARDVSSGTQKTS
jgi:EAL and modified HD-GYP domain-containing signal transduction protein